MPGAIVGSSGDERTGPEAVVEMLAGQPAAAEERLRAGYEKLDEMGEKALLATTAAMLAQAVYAQDRHEEAAELCRVSERAAAANDLTAQVEWRGVQAKVLAGQGRVEKAQTRKRSVPVLRRAKGGAGRGRGR